MEKTIKDAADRWLRGRREGKWFHYDERYVSVLLGHLGADTPLTQITRGAVADFRDSMLETRKPGTVNRYLTVLRSILNMARDEWEWIESAPKIKRMREEERVNWITKDQARRLVSYLPQHLAAMVTFALATGLRSSNIKELRWDQLDSSMAVLSIPGSEMKSGRDFSAPLNEKAREVLRGQRGLHEKFVFVFRGKPVKQCNTRTFKQACAAAGVPDTRFHDLRHTFASWHIQGGTHQAKLRELGGWSSDRMVQRYAHLGRQHLVEAVEETSF